MTETTTNPVDAWSAASELARASAEAVAAAVQPVAFGQLGPGNLVANLAEDVLQIAFPGSHHSLNECFPSKESAQRHCKLTGENTGPKLGGPGGSTGNEEIADLDLAYVMSATLTRSFPSKSDR